MAGQWLTGPPFSGSLPQLAFTAGGRVLLTFDRERGVSVWDMAGEREVRVLGSGDSKQPWPALSASSPDGRSLVTVDTEVRIWETSKGRERARYGRPASTGLFTVAFSSDGRYLALSGEDGFRLRDLVSGKESGPFVGHGGGVRTFAFSADGRRLATGGVDTSILVWDLARLRPEAAPRTDPGPRELDSWWDDLASLDATRAYQAACGLITSTGSAVSLLKGRVKPVSDLSAEKLDRLIADLDDKQFAVREKATRELTELAADAEPAMRAALAKKPGLDVSRRLEDILKRIKAEVPPERQRMLRELEVLEQIGTPEARQVVETLAGGAAEVRLTQEARAARDRLAHRQDKGRE